MMSVNSSESLQMVASWVLLIIIQGVASTRLGRALLNLCNVSYVGFMNDVFGILTL